MQVSAFIQRGSDYPVCRSCPITAINGCSIFELARFAHSDVISIVFWLARQAKHLCGLFCITSIFFPSCLVWSLVELSCLFLRVTNLLELGGLFGASGLRWW